jgi:drug/metabolite transporter (DMT)-like permease
MTFNDLLLMLLGVLISSFSQILLKKSAQKASSYWLAQYLNPYVIAGYGLLGAAMLIPLYIYQFVDLKYGAIIETLGYATVMILSALLLKERITKKKLLGNLLIVAGVLLFNAS